MSRVLIVEDEAHLANGLRFNLEAEGHSVEVVGDGERALDLLLGSRKNEEHENVKPEDGQREDGKERKDEERERRSACPAHTTSARHDVGAHGTPSR